MALQGITAPFIEVADLDGSPIGRGFLVMRIAGDGTLADRIGDGDAGSLARFAEMGSVLASIHEIPFAGSGFEFATPPKKQITDPPLPW